MNKHNLKKLLAVLLSLVAVISTSSISTLAKGKSAEVWCATEGVTTGQAGTVYVYSFPYYDSQTPQIEGQTMSVYSSDGIYLGETGPLHRDSQYQDVFDASKPIYTFQWNGKIRLFQPSGSFVVPEGDESQYLKK